MRGTRIAFKAVTVCASLALLGAPVLAIADDVVLDGNGSAAETQAIELGGQAQGDEARGEAGKDVTVKEANEEPMLQSAPDTGGQPTVLGQDKGEASGPQAKSPLTVMAEDGSKKTINDYKLVKKADNPKFVDGTYYFAKTDTPSTIVYDRRADIEGNVTFVIGDNVTLNFQRGIHLPKGSKLTIYDNFLGAANGKVVSAFNDNDGNAGIGGNDGESAGDLIVTCGTVSVRGKFKGAAIGGGRNGNGGKVEMVRGEIEAVNNEGRGAAIGGGENGNAGKVYVRKNGVITASAKGTSYGAGIGGGLHGNGDLLEVNGGKVVAVGGDASAAVGGGRHSDPGRSSKTGHGGNGGNVYIDNSGTLEATSSKGGAAVGAGSGASDKGFFTYFGDYCLTKNGTPVDADDRENVLAGSDARVLIEHCSHKDYSYVEQDEKCHEKLCKYCGRSFGTEAHQYGDDDICDMCGYNRKQLRPPVQVYAHSVSLTGSIGFRTYLLLDKAIDPKKDAGKYMAEFYGEDGQVCYVARFVGNKGEGTDVAETKTVVIDGEERTAYIFSISTFAQEMKRVFTLKIKNVETDEMVDFANNDGTIIAGDQGLPYSVMDYLDNRIKYSTDAKMVQLAKDMKNFGIYAKHYFDVLHGSDEALPIIDDFKPVTADEIGVTYTVPKDMKHFKYAGATLNMLDSTSFRLNFESDDVKALDFTVTKDGKTQHLVPVNKGGKKYCVEITGIFAQDLDEMYDFTISNGEETATCHHGPFGYAVWALTSSSNVNLQYLMMSMYHYNKSAEDYLNK